MERSLLTGMEPEPTVGTCAICGGPLSQVGPKGQCLRCLVGLGFLGGSQEPGKPETRRRLTPGPLKYDHFEVEVGADGFPIQLGAGAMAITYRARDTILNSEVALKVIDRSVAENPGVRSRFLREARTAAQIHHPNVARVSHYGEQDGECFYVMELVEGETLEARVRREGPMPLALALEVTEQAARALAAAEACGVVHRDIKPSNIMLESDASGALVVKVIDYGVAKVLAPQAGAGAEQTQAGFIGTPAFASPEQFAENGKSRIDTRSDIYSLGVTLWFLLCGRTPFVGRTLEEVAARQAEELPLEQLKVAHVLEGSVQRSGDGVRVNVQLIKAANDSHLWADTFDRKLTDIFSVESEVAKAIAEQLRAKLTGQEEQVIAAKPTDNPQAYDAYLRGLAYSLKTANTPANVLGAQKYLKEAVQLDPKFALAWARLSYTDAVSYSTLALQPTVALREEVRQAAESALTLQPNLGEAVHAKGYYNYACLKDYDTAVRYFEQARPLLPNNSLIPESLALVARRRGQWDRSESYFNEAERLDPRNVNLLTQHALSYILLRRFPEALRKLDQVLNITPDDVDTFVQKANIAQAEGDLPRASAILGPLRPGADDAQALETQVYQTILERRPGQMNPRLKEVLAKPDPALGYLNGELRFYLGWAQEVA